jgi:hypothetical protein
MQESEQSIDERPNIGNQACGPANIQENKKPRRGSSQRGFLFSGAERSSLPFAHSLGFLEVHP